MNSIQGQGICFRAIGKLIPFTIPATFWLSFFWASPATAFNFKPIGTYSTGIFGDEAARIPAYDPLTQTVWVTNNSTNQINVLNIANPTNPTLVSNIDLTPFGASVNSVTYSKGLFAVAVTNEEKTQPGNVLLFNSTGNLLKQLSVGALPDSLKFSPDGTKLLVANEGEPNNTYTTDPEGSVSIIDLSGGVENLTQANVFTAGFSQFNNALLDESVRIFGPNASVAQDLEPEDLTISADGKTAWVTLQENNAIGILNLDPTQGDIGFTDIVGLGYKDFSLPGNGLDASDEDGEINITNWPVFGLFLPDEIESYEVNGQTYLVTPSEGDSREYTEEDEEGNETIGLVEETTVGDVTLDPTAFPNAEELQLDENLGSLEITNTLGDTDGDGDFDELYAFGGRSFSIWDEEGNLVFDSGDDFEQITARLFPEFFNSNNDENNFDNRSDNKGPEPEGVTIGKVGQKTYAFIGLERVGGVMVYDITTPENALFVDYFNNRDFSVEFDENEEGDPAPNPLQLAAVGDLGPEGLIFIDPEDSPTGEALLVVANEVSGTTTVYSVTVPEPGTMLGLFAVTSLGGFVLKRKRTH